MWCWWVVTCKFFLKTYFKSHCNTANFQVNFLGAFLKTSFLTLQSVCDFAKIGQWWRMWPFKINIYQKWHNVYNAMWMSNLVTIFVEIKDTRASKCWNHQNEFSFYERNMCDTFSTNYYILKSLSPSLLQIKFRFYIKWPDLHKTYQMSSFFFCNCYHLFPTLPPPPPHPHPWHLQLNSVTRLIIPTKLGRIFCSKTPEPKQRSSRIALCLLRVKKYPLKSELWI